jgi:uncharacterized protein
VTASTATRPAASIAGRVRRAVRGERRETVVVWLAVGVIAVHVLDDSFVQPPAGTFARDHLVSGLVPFCVLALAAWAHPRLRGGRRGALALVLGVLGVAAGVEAVRYADQVGPSGDDFTGLLAFGAGLLLLATGAVTLWRTRRTDGRLAWRIARRSLLGLAGVVIAYLIVMPVTFAYVTTHVGRAVVPAPRLGVAYEDVSFTTADGLRLRGWYIPSRNGAAVIAFPGRRGPQMPARMLARHGYGVLLFDRRGEGRSEGRPNAWGWGGEQDVAAAVAFLRRRPDVHDGRIGGLGLSVGGEIMLQAASESDGLKAVVSEGAGARAFSDDMDQDLHGVEQWTEAVFAGVKTAAIAVFSDRRPPPNLKGLVGRIAPRPLLLIAAPNSGVGEELNRGYYAAAGRPKTLWEIPESRHVGGLAARPAEYERRVVAFYDRALLR